mmetsp:Transcript_45474/g.98875  ORF Transcript_45474/g.98875 Transcript_45474/m.98875 type:complete len:212 (+) Transcript_45474:274-909(+)
MRLNSFDSGRDEEKVRVVIQPYLSVVLNEVFPEVLLIVRQGTLQPLLQHVPQSPASTYQEPGIQVATAAMAFGDGFQPVAHGGLPLGARALGAPENRALPFGLHDEKALLHLLWTPEDHDVSGVHEKGDVTVAEVILDIANVAVDLELHAFTKLGLHPGAYEDQVVEAMRLSGRPEIDAVEASTAVESHEVYLATSSAVWRSIGNVRAVSA